MSGYSKAGLSGLLFSILALYFSLTDRDTQAYVALICSCIFLAASFVAQPGEAKK